MSSRILLVDDEPDIAKLLSVRLRSLGYDVDCAASGSEAIEKVEREAPDLIICDVMMPPPNGVEVCRKLKDDPRFSSIPLILLSAKSSSADRDEGMGAGANLYLGKPYDRKELVEHIKRLLGEGDT